MENEIEQAISILQDNNLERAQIRPVGGAFNVILDLIISNLSGIQSDFKVSQEVLADKVEDIIWKIENEESPIDEFYSHLDQLTDDLEESTEYTISFPISVDIDSIDGLNTPIRIRDVEIDQLDQTKWEVRVRDAREEDRFDSFLDEFPRQLNRAEAIPPQDNTFFEVKYSAYDRRYVADHIESVLELLIGEINYSSYYRRATPIRGTSSQWPQGWSKLKTPLCYIIHIGSSYETYHLDSDFSPRHHMRLVGTKQERFKQIYPTVPDFSGDISEVDDRIQQSLRAYQQGISETDQRRAFLSFWQSLESITFSGDRDSTQEILDRAYSHVSVDHSQLMDERIGSLTIKRNNLVHSGRPIEISQIDVELLKLLADANISFVVGNRSNYDTADFEFIYSNHPARGKSIEKMKEKRKRLIENTTRELELVTEMENWSEK